MFPSLAFSIFFFLFFLRGAVAVDLINQTCKETVKSNPSISYNFCVTSLQAVPSSHEASLKGLGLISLKLIKTNATNTNLYIKKMLKQEKLNSVCLQDCLGLYSEAIHDSINGAIKSFNSKDYGGANIRVTAAMTDATTCETGFKEVKKCGISPLTKKNNHTFGLGAIALAIMNMLA